MRGIFLIALGVAGWLIYKLYLRQLLAQGTAGRIKIGLIAVGFVFLALALTGRAPALFAVLGALMTQAMRLWPLLVRFAPDLMKHLNAGNPFGPDAAGSAQRRSQVRTATVLMTLDHASGRMDGEVLDGPLAGRALSALDTAALGELHAHCRAHDPEALRLLEAYIARERAGEFGAGDATGGAGSGRDGPGGGPGGGPSHGPGAGPGGGSGGGPGGGPGGGNGRMDEVEAAEVLGVARNADRDAIVAAHRALMGRLHPDKGGSDYLATKVNMARQVLLDALERERSRRG